MNVLALIIVGTSMIMIGYESLAVGSVRFPTEPMMIIIGYFFGKQVDEIEKVKRVFK